MKTAFTSGFSKPVCAATLPASVAAIFSRYRRLLPSGREKESASTLRAQGSELESSGIPLDTESARLSDFLSKMEGVGRAEVLLSSEGAVVLCEGADNSSVRLYVTNAVSVYTGLGSDKIRIIKLK